MKIQCKISTKPLGRCGHCDKLVKQGEGTYFNMYGSSVVFHQNCAKDVINVGKVFTVIK